MAEDCPPGEGWRRPAKVLFAEAVEKGCMRAQAFGAIGLDVFIEVMKLRCDSQGHELDGAGVAHDNYQPKCVWCTADMSDSAEWKHALALKASPNKPDVVDSTRADDDPEADEMADKMLAMSDDEYQAWYKAMEDELENMV